MSAENDSQEVLMFTVPEAAGRLKISRSHLYCLMGRKELPFVKLGRSRRIPAEALNLYVRTRTETSREN